MKNECPAVYTAQHSLHTNIWRARDLVMYLDFETLANLPFNTNTLIIQTTLLIHDESNNKLNNDFISIWKTNESTVWSFCLMI